MILFNTGTFVTEVVILPMLGAIIGAPPDKVKDDDMGPALLGTLGLIQEDTVGVPGFEEVTQAVTSVAILRPLKLVTQ